MDSRILLAKSITLLYRESLLPDRSDNSNDLVRTVLENVKVGDIQIGVATDRDIILGLKSTVLEMCGNNQDYEYNVPDLLSRIKINCGNDEKFYEIIRSAVETDITDSSLKRSIVNNRHSINNHFKEQSIASVLKKASYTFNYERDGIKDVNQFLAETIVQLEHMHINGVGKDPAMMEEVDMSDEASLMDAYARVQEAANGDRVYKTGWQDVNEALQGGVRVETLNIGALQHKYKTGFNLSLFAQIAQYNKPFTKDPSKKPLLLRISFEDSVLQNLQFLYTYFKYDETHEFVDVKEVSKEEMAAFVKKKMQATGFHIKMMRVDPAGWTYKSICNKVIELEAQGYVVEVLEIDYLSKLPTTDCISSGPMGTDTMDQLSRVRNFCAAKGIAYINVHQISTEAKNILRNQIVPEDQFVKEIAERGFWERTKGLDRVYDCCLLLHLFKQKGETFLSVFREKHRLPTIVDEDKRLMYFKFPKGMPIPSDLMSEKISFRKMKYSNVSNASEDIFSSVN